MERQRIPPFSTAIAFHRRPVPVAVTGPDVCFRVPLAYAPYARGALAPLCDPGLWEGSDAEIDGATTTMMEASAGEGCCTSVGADFQTVGAMLQEMQGPGLPAPPWEFRLVVDSGGHMLQFRSAQ